MNQLIVKVDLILYCNHCIFLAVLYMYYSCCVDISNYARLATNFVCLRKCRKHHCKILRCTVLVIANENYEVDSDSG